MMADSQLAVQLQKEEEEAQLRAQEEQRLAQEKWVKGLNSNFVSYMMLQS